MQRSRMIVFWCFCARAVVGKQRELQEWRVVWSEWEGGVSVITATRCPPNGVMHLGVAVRWFVVVSGVPVDTRRNVPGPWDRGGQKNETTMKISKQINQ